MPGQFDEEQIETTEYIDMKENFDPFEYMIYHQQEKDQITLLLVPRTMLLNHSEWIGYNSVTDHDMPAGSEI